MNNNFNVSLEAVVDNNLGFEAYFILWCLYNKQESKLYEYTQNCKKISLEEFTGLADKGLVVINDSSIVNKHITASDLRLTEKANGLFELDNFEELFKELKQAYPSWVKNGPSKRALHTDMKRCKSLYKKIIGDDIEMHKLICKCAKLYHQEKRRSNSEQFMQNLVTWLHQQNYEVYMEEAQKDNIVEEGGTEYIDDI